MKVRAVKFPTQSFVRTITPLHTHLLRVVARLLCRVLPRRAPTTNHPTTNHHTSFAIKSGPPPRAPSSGHTSLLNFQSYSAPPVTPRAGLPRPFSTAPPCPPPNTPPHACRVVHGTCLSGSPFSPIPPCPTLEMFALLCCSPPLTSSTHHKSPHLAPPCSAPLLHTSCVPCDARPGCSTPCASQSITAA
jgi:hypothetical protein